MPTTPHLELAHDECDVCGREEFGVFLPMTTPEAIGVDRVFVCRHCLTAAAEKALERPAPANK